MKRISALIAMPLLVSGIGAHAQRIGPVTHAEVGQPDGVAGLDAAGRVPEIDVANPKDTKWAGGAKGNYNPTTGVGTDDTAAINDAAASLAATGGTVLLEGGNFAIAGTSTYNALVLPSGVTLRCEGGATLTAIGPNANNLAIVQNVNYAARTLTDHDLKVDGCNFVFPNWTSNAGVGTAVAWWFASHTSVVNSTFHGGAKATAGIGVFDDVVDHNKSYGDENPYEHWWGSSRVRITHNYAELPVSSQPYGIFGIEVTGQDSDNNPVAADDILIADNDLYYANLLGGAPISIDGIAAISHVSILNNHVYVTGTGSLSPAIFYGVPGKDVQIRGNSVDGPKIQPAIFVNNPSASDVVVEGNLLSDCAHSGASGYVANILSNALHTTFTGNRQDSTSCTGAMISHLADATLVGNDDGTGAVSDYRPSFSAGNLPQSAVTLTGSTADTAAPITTPIVTIGGATGNGTGAILPNTKVAGVQVLLPGFEVTAISFMPSPWTLYTSADTGILGGASSWTIEGGGSGISPVISVFTLTETGYGYTWVRTFDSTASATAANAVQQAITGQSAVTLTGSTAATAAPITTPVVTVGGASGGGTSAILPNTMSNGVQIIAAGYKQTVISLMATAWTLFTSADTGILGGGASWTIASGGSAATPIVAEFTLTNTNYGYQWVQTRTR